MATRPHAVCALGCALLLSMGAFALAAPAQTPSPAPEQPKCEFQLGEFEPKSAATTTFTGREAALYLEALTHSRAADREPIYDRVVLRSGPDVFGGTAVLVAKGECVLGHGFFSPLDQLYADEMLRLHTTQADLRSAAHVEPSSLQVLAEAGDPIAQFHEGLALALGWDREKNRVAGVVWLKRSAETGYAPGMLALGMALSGPGSLEDEARIDPPRRDEATDELGACVWLELAARCDDRRVAAIARLELDFRDVKARLTREQRGECKRLLRERE